MWDIKPDQKCFTFWVRILIVIWLLKSGPPLKLNHCKTCFYYDRVTLCSPGVSNTRTADACGPPDVLAWTAIKRLFTNYNLDLAFNSQKPKIEGRIRPNMSSCTPQTKFLATPLILSLMPICDFILTIFIFIPSIHTPGWPDLFASGPIFNRWITLQAATKKMASFSHVKQKIPQFTLILFKIRFKK